MTYKYMKRYIVISGKNRETLMSMCDAFLFNSRITIDEYTELTTMINELYPEAVVPAEEVVENVEGEVVE